MVASEAQPFAKTGGLADVLGALPRALTRVGHDVDVVIPRYRGISAGERIGSVSVALGGQVAAADVWSVIDGGVRAVFIGHQPYCDGDYLYGVADRDYADNAERFAFFCQAALEWAASTGLRYDVVHAHDWQGGLVPVLLRRMDPTRWAVQPATVFTIHNL